MLRHDDGVLHALAEQLEPVARRLSLAEHGLLRQIVVELQIAWRAKRNEYPPVLLWHDELLGLLRLSALVDYDITLAIGIGDQLLLCRAGRKHQKRRGDRSCTICLHAQIIPYPFDIINSPHPPKRPASTSLRGQNLTRTRSACRPDNAAGLE